MFDTLENTLMVNPISETNNMKPIDSDSHLKSNQHEPDSSIKSASKSFEALKASLQNIPEINETHVLYFRTEIQSGSYQTNSNKIAMKMLHQVEMA